LYNRNIKKRVHLAGIFVLIFILAYLISLPITGQAAQDMNVSITVSDFPKITIISPENTTYNYTTIDFNVSLSKNGSWCGYCLDREISACNGIVGWMDMTKYNSTYFNYTKTGLADNSRHHVSFSCNDTQGNMNTTDKLYFTVNKSWVQFDPTPPVITPVSPADGYSSTTSSGSKSLDFKFNVSDSGDISNCSLIIGNSIVRTNTSINKSEVNKITYTVSGSKTWKIGCRDDSNNASNSSSRSLTISQSSDDDGDDSSGGGGTPTPCTDTCESLGYECGEWTICNVEKDCGSCGAGEECSWGQCVELDCNTNWECTEWSSCDPDTYTQTRECQDLNNCGTEEGKPSEQQSCYPDDEEEDEEEDEDEEEECIPQWSCGEWSECNADYTLLEIVEGETEFQGEQQRTCEDLGDCEDTKTEVRSCEIESPIRTRLVEWCGEEYIELIDKDTGELVARVKVGEEEDVSIGFIVGDFVGYCDYCYDGVQNYDEQGVDCGGPGCPPCEEGCNIFISRGWNFVSFCRDTSGYSMENLINILPGEVPYMLEWDENTQEFKIWSEKGIKEFSNFDDKKSYFIFYYENDPLDYGGGLIDSLEVDLQRGWESPIYPLIETTEIRGSDFYGADVNYMLRWDKMVQEFEVYSSKTRNDMLELFPTEGVFVHTDGGKIVYQKG
jgi:hypothetical protein